MLNLTWSVLVRAISSSFLNNTQPIFCQLSDTACLDHELVSPSRYLFVRSKKSPIKLIEERTMWEAALIVAGLRFGFVVIRPTCRNVCCKHPNSAMASWYSIQAPRVPDKAFYQLVAEVCAREKVADRVSEGHISLQLKVKAQDRIATPKQRPS